MRTELNSPSATAFQFSYALSHCRAPQVLGRDLVMVPKLIHPLPPNTPYTPDSVGGLEVRALPELTWLCSAVRVVAWL